MKTLLNKLWIINIVKEYFFIVGIKRFFTHQDV